MRMKFISAVFCLAVLFIRISPVQAVVVCEATTQITNDSAEKSTLQFNGNSLVWFAEPHTLWRYDLTTTTATPVGTNVGYLNQYGDPVVDYTVDGDHIVWIDTNHQVQLYTISTGATLQMTNSTKPMNRVYLDGNHIVWLRFRKQIEAIDYYDYFVYDIAAETTTRFARKQTLYAIGLGGGRFIWNQYDPTDVYNSSVYDITSGTTTVKARGQVPGTGRTVRTRRALYSQ